MKKALLGAAITAALSASSAHAYTINFDGTAATAVNNVGALGWNTGDAISTIAFDALGNPLSHKTPELAVGDIIQTYGHATLANFNDTNGNTINGAITAGKEWTYVFGFEEVVTAAPDANNRNFAAVTTGNDFFQIWAGSADSSTLSGKNFQNGTLILSGTVEAVNPAAGTGTGNFSSNSSILPALDQFGTNNYVGHQTVTGSGGGTLDVKVVSQDFNYFTGNLKDLLFNFQTFQNLAFQQTNPSSCFWDGTSYFAGAGAFTGSAVAADGTVTTGCGSGFGTVGQYNGLPSGVVPGYTAADNTMFQTRSTSNFPITTVPEPGAIAILGLGLLGMSRIRRRK